MRHRDEPGRDQARGASSGARQAVPREHGAAGPSGPPTTGPAGILALQRTAGNRIVLRLIAEAGVQGAMYPGVQRDVDEAAAYIAEGDWTRAAAALASTDDGQLTSKISALSSVRRQYLTEGARHIGGDRVIAAVDAIDHRAAVLGSIRFFLWKHQWAEAGTYLCGLNNADMERIVLELKLTTADLGAIVRQQPDTEQSVRLTTVLFNPDFQRQVPQDLVGADPGKLVFGWLIADPLVGPYATSKWSGGAVPNVRVVPEQQWIGFYAKQTAGHFDPELGRPRTLAEATARAPKVDGTTTSEDIIYLRKGGSSPGALIHEAIHALAPSAFDDEFGRGAEEGTAEYFARRVARNAGKHAPTAYSDEHAAIAALAGVVGDPALAAAYFTGRTLALSLAVDDAKGAGTFAKWRRAMNDPGERKAAIDALR